MLKQEARWFQRSIAAHADGLFPMLNVGSHTDEFRRREQPWVDRYVFAPMRRGRRRVVHTDIRDAAGVDIVGDLLDPAFIERLQPMGFRSAMCCNVLEHVPEPERLAGALVTMLPPGGLVLASVPHRFPYHPDPIDTMFRPDAAELASLFEGTDVVAADVVPAGTFANYLVGRLLRSPRRVLRASRSAPDASRGESLLPWLVRRFEVSCVVLEKRRS